MTILGFVFSFTKSQFCAHFLMFKAWIPASSVQVVTITISQLTVKGSTAVSHPDDFNHVSHCGVSGLSCIYSPFHLLFPPSDTALLRSTCLGELQVITEILQLLGKLFFICTMCICIPI